MKLIYILMFFITFVCSGFGDSKWGTFEVKECSGDCVREYSSKLNDLPPLSDYQQMCEKAPAIIDNYFFKQPSRCVFENGTFVYGKFDVPDMTCCSINTVQWMKSLPSDKVFSEFSIPGTHGSCTSGAPAAYKCQGKTLCEQLNLGIRYFDIRCRLINDRFAIYHGHVYLNMNFDDVQTIFKNFLIKHPSEFILVSVQHDYDVSGTNRKTFGEVLEFYINKAKKYWYLKNKFPRISEIRGKMVLIRKNFYAKEDFSGIFINPQYNTKFSTISDKYPFTFIQDYCCESTYSQQFIDDKIAAVKYLLDRSANDTSQNWYINYLNVAYNGVMPETYASILNPRLRDYLIKFSKTSSLYQLANRRLGTIVMDFPENVPSLIRNIISLNLFNIQLAGPVQQNRQSQYYKQIKQTTVSSCFDECVKDVNCAAVSMQPSNGNGYCFLSREDQVDPLEFDINYISLSKQSPG